MQIGVRFAVRMAFKHVFWSIRDQRTNLRVGHCSDKVRNAIDSDIPVARGRMRTLFTKSYDSSWSALTVRYLASWRSRLLPAALGWLAVTSPLLPTSIKSYLFHAPLRNASLLLTCWICVTIALQPLPSPRSYCCPWVRECREGIWWWASHKATPAAAFEWAIPAPSSPACWWSSGQGGYK